MNGPMVLGLGGSRHLQPGGPSALALGPPSVLARQAPRQCWRKGGRLARAYCRLCRMLQGLLPVGVTLRGQLLPSAFTQRFPISPSDKTGFLLVSERQQWRDPAHVGSSQLVLTVLVGCVFGDVRDKGTMWNLACTVNHCTHLDSSPLNTEGSCLLTSEPGFLYLSPEDSTTHSPLGSGTEQEV